jgi:hypothetical protein
MMNAVMTVENTEMQIREYNGQRVVTFKDIDIVHRRKNGTARKNFTNNKKHFIKDEDYFEISREDVGENFSPTYGFSEKAPSGILITETGYLMLVKSFRDDFSWDVQRKLVNSYFRQRETVKKEQEELSDIPKSPLLEKDRDWFRTRKPKIRQVCDAYEVTKREFMHHLLDSINQEYCFDDARKKFIQMENRLPWSNSEVITYFPQLTQLADEILENDLKHSLENALDEI